VEFLRTCIEPASYSWKDVKPQSGPQDLAAMRFANLLTQLRSGVPEIEFAVAEDLARVGDRYRAASEALHFH
jgi:hypothetical protein